MAIVSIRCDVESKREFEQRAKDAGYESPSDYARKKLGLKLTERGPAREPRIRLRLSKAEKLAIERAREEHGFANPSAYVRARLFLAPPPPAPIVDKSGGDDALVSYVLQRGDEARLASAMKRAKLAKRPFLLRQIFGASTA